MVAGVKTEAAVAAELSGVQSVFVEPWGMDRFLWQGIKKCVKNATDFLFAV